MKPFIRILTYISENVLPLLFWVLIIFGLDTADIALTTILAAIIHEAGHLLAIYISGRQRRSFKPHISGFRIRATGGGYREEILTLAAGPLMNLAAFLALLPFSKRCEFIYNLGYISLVTAFSNLMPLEGYDGYGILYKVFSAMSMTRAMRALEYISFAVSILLTFLSLYFLLKIGEGYWIFGVFFSMLITKIIKLNKTDILRE